MNWELTLWKVFNDKFEGQPNINCWKLSAL